MVHIGAEIIKDVVHFFENPILRIGKEVKPDRIQITIASGRKNDGTLIDRETFKGIIWTLNITNKHPKKIPISKMASDCFPFIHIEESVLLNFHYAGSNIYKNPKSVSRMLQYLIMKFREMSIIDF